MNTYDEKSCNALEKPYYSPIEAALRWCNLTKHEPEIIGAMTSGEMTPPRNRFPQWPCLYLNTEKIMDAVRHGELRGGRDGVTVTDSSGVAKHRLTIRHTDLKKWMTEHEPGKTPAFLFGEGDLPSRLPQDDIDPADLPDELSAANIAFRAVTNGHGDPFATFKNRLIGYLQTNFPDLSSDAVKRVATVANPDKAPGRKNFNAE